MNASAFIKETSALISLCLTIYLWSLVALALQS